MIGAPREAGLIGELLGEQDRESSGDFKGIPSYTHLYRKRPRR